jgi:hypothetical protein
MARRAVAAAQETVSPLQEVERLTGERTKQSAARLAELAASPDKALSKAARRGLYILKQAGIEPPAVPSAVVASAAPVPQLANQAYATNPDNSGNQMLLFVQEDPWGGSPWLLTFLTSYVTGLKDLGASKLSRREIAESLDDLRSRPGRIVVEVPVDYARWLLQKIVEINRKESFPIPQGYSEDLKRVGLPEKTYARPLVYDYLDAEQVQSDQSISRDPDNLFEHDQFKIWLINLQVIAPWVRKYAEAFNTTLALDEAQLKQRGDKVIDEAADALLAESGAVVYRRLLEESALALHLHGDDTTARQALYHALSLSEDQPPHENPFLRAMTARSIFILIALMAEEEDERARAEGRPLPGRAIEPDPQESTIIERV